MFDKQIGNTESADVAGSDTRVGCGLEHGAAESSGQRSFLDGDDERAFSQGSKHDLSIERFDEAGVDDTDVDALPSQLIAGLQAI